MTDKNLKKFLDEDFVRKTKVCKKHKYIFFLTIAELYYKNSNRENKFTIDELVEPFYINFSHYTNTIPSNKNIVEYPFFYLKNNNFWFLKIKTNKELEYYEIIEKHHSRFTTKKNKRNFFICISFR